MKQLKSLQKTGYFSDLKLPVQVPVNLLGRYHDIGKTGVDSKLWNSTGPVSYTHLDVYKRQVLP